MVFGQFMSDLRWSKGLVILGSVVGHHAAQGFSALAIHGRGIIVLLPVDEEAIEKKELSVQLGLGAEYTYGSQLHDEIQAGEARTIDGGKYVLLELPERHLPHTIPTALFQLV